MICVRCPGSCGWKGNVLIDLTIVGDKLARIKNYAAAAKERSRLLRDKLAQKQQIRMNREWLAADRKKRDSRDSGGLEQKRNS